MSAEPESAREIACSLTGCFSQGNRWHTAAYAMNSAGEQRRCDKAATPAIALCIAALKAKDSRHE